MAIGSIYYMRLRQRNAALSMEIRNDELVPLRTLRQQRMRQKK